MTESAPKTHAAASAPPAAAATTRHGATAAAMLSRAAMGAAARPSVSAMSGRIAAEGGILTPAGGAGGYPTPAGGADPDVMANLSQTAPSVLSCTARGAAVARAVAALEHTPTRRLTSLLSLTPAAP